MGKGNEVITENDLKHLVRAVDLAEAALDTGNDPLGSVLVADDGRVLLEGHNWIGTGDGTRHPEMDIARWAATNLAPEERAKATVYTSGEHCPMCAAAIHWARLDAVAYGATIADARAAGFHELACDCRALYEQGGSRVEIHEGIRREECQALFKLWLDGPCPEPY